MFDSRIHLTRIRALATTACLVLVVGCNSVEVADPNVGPQGPIPSTAPATPTGLVATAGNAQANLSWTASSGAANYVVKRSTTSGGPYTEVASPTATAYSNASLTNGTTYYYVVSAVNSAGASDNSTQAAVVPAASSSNTIPASPTGLVAIPGNAQASLSWLASTGAASYAIKRATTSGGPYTQVATSTTTTYINASLTNGTAYFYVVSAVSSAGASANSAQASVTPVAPVVARPSAPSGLSARSSNAQVTLTWSATSGATGYNIKRATTSGGSFARIAGSTTPNYIDSSVVNGTAYYYVVSALNSSGESDNSAQVSATPAAPAPVGTCDHLPAPGVWENVTPPGTAAGAVNGTDGASIIVDPFDPKRVWLGTGLNNDEIWRSDNCGSTWTRVNTGPGGVGDGRGIGGVGDGIQWSMVVDPVEMNVMYAVSGYGAESLWKSTDGGFSWKDVLIGSEFERVANYRFANTVSMDPTDHRHLVVSTHGDCAAPYNPSCLTETYDGGSTWRIMRAPEGWTEGGGLIVVKGGLWVWCGTQLMVTKDSGQTWTVGGGSCESQYIMHPFVPASNGKYYLGTRSGVLRSSNGETWEKIPGTNGFMVMIAQGSGKVFAASQWDPTLKWASLDNDEVWNSLPSPPQNGQSGIPFLAYDEAHKILYASMFLGGVARMVVP